ncbi:HNH endonuclease [Xylanimonas cellulosilytica DSM 15894]|uniref:HNH endonuclease n=1 Tax=Xylanimonas cellulosilytica (strain DSM 15894 / JCM 12276 / CECT 5975 / KCTC 9989 / LMG 20990 / NBRC 107835 / XIL07) TaxID=446471 RepID=D1BWN6_XYLCX|nr:HNH endonuclease [Xylanimonas cellulosilytica]ACZ29618.1 HNH endonuclease [Xylanimonas cellulosilytica DSM 15894]
MAYQPFEFPEWNGVENIDNWKYRRRRALKIHEASQSPLLRLRGPDGEPLYRMNDSGSIRRTRQASSTTIRRVKERDGYRCVWCGSADNLEVDHIVRYADGGSNTPDNLRTLCHGCHGSRGGRP